MLANMLYFRFCTIYGHKFSKGHTDDLIKIWVSDWSLGISGIDELTIKKSVNYCILNLDWPPSIAEFRKICEEILGILSTEQIIKSVIDGKLTDPLVQYVYQDVTSWAFKNDKEIELVKKVSKSRKNYLEKERIKLINNKNEFKVDSGSKISPRLEVVV